MAPPANKSKTEVLSRDPLLSNVSHKGLGYYDKHNQLVMVTDVELQMIGT